MHEHADRLSHALVTADEDVEREFEVRLVECSTLAFRIAYSVLRHREDAEDVAQEAFAKAYRNFRQLRDRERFQPWLVRMTWRLALDRRRGDKRRALRESACAPEESTTLSDPLEAAERRRLLWQAIDRLPGRLRIVLVLTTTEEHDVRRVARLLDLPEGTVKSRLFDARRRLRKALRWTIGH